MLQRKRNRATLGIYQQPSHWALMLSALEPSNIEDLDLVKEDIGLKDPIVVSDYPSPRNEATKYGGAKISLNEASRIKESIRGIRWKTKDDVAGPQSIHVKKGNNSSPYFVTENQNAWRDPPKLMARSPTPYIVEFPPRGEQQS